MTSEKYQRIFTYGAIGRMRAELRSGKSLKTYFKESYSAKKKDLILSTIKLKGKPPVLKAPKSDPVSADLENAIKLHEYYKGINETQASDPRLWTYLSHAEFRKYSLARWGIKEPYSNLKDERAKVKAINYVLEHWFVSGNDRDLRRHSISRLWWAAHLTYAPWEKDPEFFQGLKNKDPYYYTRVLLSKQDIYQQVLERAMGRSNRILISVLDYLSSDPGFASSRENIRHLMKELNLVYGSKKIITLSPTQLNNLLHQIVSEIKQ